jgi:NADH:ubiquinone oxidoreductase subunit C
MSNEELISALTTIQPKLEADAAGEWPVVHVEAADWPKLAQTMRFKDDLWFDYMFCLTCVDWKTHLTMVYHLTSTRYRHHVVVKSKLDREKPEIQTICDIWRTAEFHEREVYEMFGVNFLDHPDLRLLILPDDWVGYPLRKDYEDPVNMIKL